MTHLTFKDKVFGQATASLTMRQWDKYVQYEMKMCVYRRTCMYE